MCKTPFQEMSEAAEAMAARLKVLEDKYEKLFERHAELVKLHEKSRTAWVPQGGTRISKLFERNPWEKF